jgi:hypothetical protein
VYPRLAFLAILSVLSVRGINKLRSFNAGQQFDPHRPYQLSLSLLRTSEKREAAKGSRNIRAMSAERANTRSTDGSRLQSLARNDTTECTGNLRPLIPEVWARMQPFWRALVANGTKVQVLEASWTKVKIKILQGSYTIFCLMWSSSRRSNLGGSL